MRCIKMKIRDVLFFIVNFIAIYSLKVPPNREQKTTVSDANFSNFDNLCPSLSKFVRENNLTDYMHCEPLDMTNQGINQGKVLQYACIIVKKILSFMCEKGNNINSDNSFSNNDPICPFDFSHLEKLGLSFTAVELLNELKNPKQCPKVCSDLYNNKTECIVLRNFNNYLKNHYAIEEELTTEKKVEPLARIEQLEVIKSKPESIQMKPETFKPQLENDKTKLETFRPNTEIIKHNVADITFHDKNQILPKTEVKDVTKEENIENVEAKLSSPQNKAHESINEKKTEKTISSTPNGFKLDKETALFESEKKMSEFDNFNSENTESKQRNEDMIEVDDIPNEEEISSLGEAIPKVDFSQETKQSKILTPEVRVDTFSKGKEIYSGDGFFQEYDSHFFFYFITVSSIVVVGYLAFHNKNKILAYALEGTSGRRSRRRPNPAKYRKLETNLEEVISSNTTNAASSSVVY